MTALAASIGDFRGQVARHRRAFVIFGVGIAVFVVSFGFDRRALAAGAVALAGCSILAAREARAPVMTWANAVSAFVLLIWLLPIKVYRLPVNLPFNLEPYRLVLGGLAVVMLYAFAGRFRKPSAGGLGGLVAAIALSILLSQYVNLRTLDPLGGERVSLNNFFYLVTPLLVFLLVCCAVTQLADAERIVKAIVVGGSIVAVAAILQSRTGYNIFDHLNNWVPGIKRDRSFASALRGGRLRVQASAQHPIALGTVLMLTVPLAAYVVARASSRRRKLAWAAVATIIAIGAFMPIARTALVVAATMLLLALILRGRRLVRLWPALIVAAVALHFVAPGVLGAVYHAFTPQQGLVQDATGRAGLHGSGRLSDIDPGIDLWKTSPVVGIGRGNPLVGGQDGGPASQTSIIFDNQYMSTLVLTGLFGFVALVGFFVMTSSKLLNGAFVRRGPEGDLLACCGLATTGFAVGIFFFDAFSFVQVTLMYFVIAALGLRVLQLTRQAEGAAAEER
ncbi:MAG TPA: O-antigen ligase family protein [Gaiellaceae bacterium]